ncbi:hypothetical protein BHM03_00060549 [Ensete ventricosum]|nr:hypothetical protein BHM03_00060549 [Ensete ventricosum]
MPRTLVPKPQSTSYEGTNDWESDNVGILTVDSPSHWSTPGRRRAWASLRPIPCNHRQEHDPPTLRCSELCGSSHSNIGLILAEKSYYLCLHRPNGLDGGDVPVSRGGVEIGRFAAPIR